MKPAFHHIITVIHTVDKRWCSFQEFYIYIVLCPEIKLLTAVPDDLLLRHIIQSLMLRDLLRTYLVQLSNVHGSEARSYGLERQAYYR